MTAKRPPAPRPTGSGSARAHSRPAGRPGRPGSGSTPAAKGAKAKSGQPAAPETQSHVSAYAVGSPLNRQAGFFQSTGARLVVLALVLGICILMVLPVARNYFNQRSNLKALENDLAARQEQNEDLQNQLDRWKDDKYVIAQARERLTFVMPGEKPYRVMDAEAFVAPEETPESPLIKPDMSEPWFNTVWSSIEETGNLGVEQPPADAKSPGDVKDAKDPAKPVEDDPAKPAGDAPAKSSDQAPSTQD